MDVKPYILYAVTTLLLFVDVNGIPLEKNSPGRETANQNDLLEYEKQLEDEDVRELKNLKSSDATSIATSKSQKFSYINVNGKKEHHAVLNEQLNNNGKLVERIQQKIDSKQASESAAPDTRVLTEIEIPPKGIHKWFEQGDNSRNNIIKKAPRIEQKYSNSDNAVSNNLLNTLKMKNVIRYLPIEMAEYIYKTGDEKTVTMAIENYLQLGILGREEAIAYLQEIKSILNSIEEDDQRDKKHIDNQRHYVENSYRNNPRNKIEMNQALSDLQDIQQLIQNKFLKKSYSEDNPNTRYRYGEDEIENSPNNINYIDEDDAQLRSAEKDYRNLAEKLQSFEDLFSESSMEGVIYQLAKVLFYQSFSMNGFEAQESLKQFTTFLETQVEEGHISRNMERKVLDILLAALTDTLREHPELINEKSSELYKKQIQQSENAFKTIEKKNGETSKKRHLKMNLKVSGILDDNKNKH